MNKQYFVYIMTNQNNNVLYTGITNDLIRRIYEHKNKLVKGFTSRYNLDKLVWFEIYENPEDAITKEKKIKSGSRQRKTELVNSINSNWKDLFDEIIL